MSYEHCIYDKSCDHIVLRVVTVGYIVDAATIDFRRLMEEMLDRLSHFIIVISSRRINHCEP